MYIGVVDGKIVFFICVLDDFVYLLNSCGYYILNVLLYFGFLFVIGE